MKNRVCGRATIFALIIGLMFYAVSVSAQQSRQFSIAATKSTDSLNGQIDWPAGALES